MKFARYLEETHTPEWQKAYIDYRGLKKKIAAIRKAQDGPLLSDESRLDFTVSPSSSLGTRSDASSDDLGIVAPERNKSPASARSTRPMSSTQSKGGGRPNELNATPGDSAKSQEASSSSNRFGSRLMRKRPAFSRGNTAFRNPYTPPQSLNEIQSLLSPKENSFVEVLDVQLDKIETFYLNREKEMSTHALLLNDQLHELSYHRRLFHDAQEAAKPKAAERFLGIRQISKLPSRRDKSRADAEDEARFGILDPEDYRNAKKKLKKAVVEHYRGLEALHNYRILNVTGFRKALKKFEKVTKIPLLDAYMTEKVERSPFASETNVRTMMNDMESVFAVQFARGDKKRALKRLRAGLLHKSYYFSTFRSGLCLGLSLPPLVAGIYQSFLPDTRVAIPAWDGLLFVYAILFIPVVFALLVGTNLLVWSRARVNHVFIFELDYRTQLDYREYLEIPSLLLCTLAYTFWLSLVRAGAPTMDPTFWPLVWLGLTSMMLIDPLPFLFKHSRYWLFETVGRLLLPGYRRVEFSDFWMGDQFCSLVYTLGGVPVAVCVYATGFNDQWRKCGSGSHLWPLAFAITQLPLLIRLLQSIRRYTDSGLLIHLINGGKYGSGIISYLFYFLWRHQGQRNAVFALWCLFNTIYSIYASLWDFLMDWSVLQGHVKHVLLRDDLLYLNHVPLYYLAITANVVFRFIWIIYIPTGGPDLYVRSFIAALLEVCRRTVWNFYRLENEHLGNVDQYRVTREVPLPYSMDDIERDIDDDDADEVNK